MKAILTALAGAALLALGPAAYVMAQDSSRATDLFQFDSASGYSPGGGVITDRGGTIFGTTTSGVVPRSLRVARITRRSDALSR